MRTLSTIVRTRREAVRRDAGFTLIELLVVVIIIGILAAIAIPAYLGVQKSAKDSIAIQAVSDSRTLIVAFYKDKDRMPTAAEFETIAPKTASVDYAFTAGTTMVFCVSATAETGTIYIATDADAPHPSSTTC